MQAVLMLHADAPVPLTRLDPSCGRPGPGQYSPAVGLDGPL